MKIKIKIKRTNKEKEILLEKGSTAEDALERLQLKPDNVIVMSDKKPIPIDDVLTDGQELIIIQVFSGG